MGPSVSGGFGMIENKPSGKNKTILRGEEKKSINKRSPGRKAPNMRCTRTTVQKTHIPPRQSLFLFAGCHICAPRVGASSPDPERRGGGRVKICSFSSPIPVSLCPPTAKGVYLPNSSLT
ncbi:hypothetical protein AVEN_249444-1 [Araneus ventricosus]|uniref:Uncharacterized protein n=1 Tax=Araneus ventricosus TaxID=182803 RepID=A0A4Y2QR71_ARAVE|nr:hypothetical protein AVEN_249444-1 [Araneus ventricosus]